MPIPIIPFPFEPDGENIDLADFPEPSGICFHGARGTLFVIGDEGAIQEMTTAGDVLHRGDLQREDLEGVTWAPSTRMLYVAVEGEEVIIEVHADTFAITRTFDIPRTFQGDTVLKKGKDGIESVTFVPNPHHPHGGTFFVTNQAKKDKDPEDDSVLLELFLSLKSAAPVAEIKACHRMKPRDLAGLCYDAARDLLLIVSDKENRCLEVTRGGVVLHAYDLPGDDQEGIALDNEGALYIAQDSGGIMKYRPTP
jgi:uncharacterized protein YjiK